MINGANITVSNSFILGTFATSTDNELIVSGASTTINSGGLYVGYRSLRNQVAIEAGATFATGSVSVGSANTSSNNRLRISGTGSSLTSTGAFEIGPSGSDNTFTLENGAHLQTNGAARLGLNAGANNNTISVAGRGTIWNSQTFLTIGDANDNRLLIADQGLVTLGSTLYFGAGTGNFVGLDTGFLAFHGNNLAQISTWISEDRFRYWSAVSESWLTEGADDLRFDYFAAEADALAFSGYDGLGGYTIITAGSVVPEPGTVALLAGLGALGFVLVRRRRNRRPQPVMPHSGRV